MNGTRQTVQLLGIRFSDYELPQLLETVHDGITQNKNWIIANHNLHSLFLFHRREELRNFYSLTHSSHIDGMPLVWISRMYGHKLERSNRITYVDFMPPLLELANANGWRIYYLGSRPEACTQGSLVVQKRYPLIHWKAHNGYFDISSDSAENRLVIEEIRTFAPHILLVGMGMPRQEEWIARYHDELHANVFLPCGAAIDYIAGAIPTPPRWAGRSGLEWLFRLSAEPKRLGSRYLIEPWFILFLLLKDIMRKH